MLTINHYVLGITTVIFGDLKITVVCGLKLLVFSRFKQIKEQEARRRQQREEEKTKAEEAAANRIPTTNGGYKNEANSTKREYRTGGDLVDGGNDSFQSLTTTHNSSNIEVVVNDELSNEDSKDEQKMYVTRTESSENSVNYEVDVRDEQHINGKLEKVSVASMLQNI